MEEEKCEDEITVILLLKVLAALCHDCKREDLVQVLKKRFDDIEELNRMAHEFRLKNPYYGLDYLFK